jgi:hypothetical protein
MAEYEIFAIRYAMREAKRSDHFIGGDLHDGPMPMDYFTWVIRGEGRVVVVDTGFTEEVAAKRKRQFLRCPVETLAELGIAPDTVTAAHYFEHMQKNRFFVTAFNLGDMIDGYRTCERLAASPDHIIPGHDPLVMKLYPAVSGPLEGVIVRLDVPPRAEA